jgi:hypothetical protein
MSAATAWWFVASARFDAATIVSRTCQAREPSSFSCLRSMSAAAHTERSRRAS